MSVNNKQTTEVKGKVLIFLESSNDERPSILMKALAENLKFTYLGLEVPCDQNLTGFDPEKSDRIYDKLNLFLQNPEDEGLADSELLEFFEEHCDMGLMRMAQQNPVSAIELFSKLMEVEKLRLQCIKDIALQTPCALFSIDLGSDASPELLSNIEFRNNFMASRVDKIAQQAENPVVAVLVDEFRHGIADILRTSGYDVTEIRFDNPGLLNVGPEREREVFLRFEDKLHPSNPKTLCFTAEQIVDNDTIVGILNIIIAAIEADPDDYMPTLGDLF